MTTATTIARKALIAGTAAIALAGATVSVPTQANAYPVWVIPAIIGAAVGGVAVGAVASNPPAYAYEPGPYAADAVGPRGTIYVQPTADCRIVREQTPTGRWQRVRVCD